MTITDRLSGDTWLTDWDMVGDFGWADRMHSDWVRLELFTRADTTFDVRPPRTLNDHFDALGREHVWRIRYPDGVITVQACNGQLTLDPLGALLRGELTHT